MTWGEAPRWREGALWLSDTQGSALCTDASGNWTSIPVDSPSNGLWFLPDGRLVAAMMAEQRIGIWAEDRWETYADLSGLEVGPLGDMVGDARGNLYVDDVAFNKAAGEAPVPGRIILVRADGSAEVAADGVHFPNGMALIDDGSTLVVAQTFEQNLIAFDVRADGLLENRREFADIAGLVGDQALPDGIWPTPDDGVWVATTSAQSVVKVRDDVLVDRHDTAPLFPIACCLRDDGALLVTLADTQGAPLWEALAARTVTTSVAIY
ncbi:SMP-30/gluconolactonase/LRE family protein [Nocardioides sp. NPDC126508]